MAERPTRRITLLDSDEAISPKLINKDAELVELWIRQPDSERLEEITLGARLCSCRRVCLAVIEDSPTP